VGFRFRRGESVPRAIRRIAGEQLRYAASQLRDSVPASRDTAVHEARKSIKKARAVVRLMAGELGPVAEAENELLRNLALKVSPLRDAAVLVQTFDSLEGHFPETVCLELLERIRTALLKNRSRAARTSAAARSPATIAFALERATQRARAWPLRNDGFDAIAPGLRRALRRGRKALREVLVEPSPARYHEFRKRVKDHWYHVRLLEDAWTQETKLYEKDLKALETVLGDDHNLVVLSERLASLGTAEEVVGLQEAIAARQKKLREEAVDLGKRLYGPKPGVFVRQAEELWANWQMHPKRRSTPAVQPMEPGRQQAPAA
jgi:CHAD domain-containing protein